MDISLKVPKEHEVWEHVAPKVSSSEFMTITGYEILGVTGDKETGIVYEYRLICSDDFGCRRVFFPKEVIPIKVEV
jgi:hypothetical protein